MKKNILIRLVPGLLLLSTAFCVYTPLTATAGSPRFREGNAADVVLEYSSWDTIMLMRPEIRENGFLPVLTHNSVVAEIAHHNPGHNLVVVILHNMVPAEQAAVIRDWETLLGNGGFHRVVFLRCSQGRSKGIDGLPIIQDSVIAGVSDDSAKSVATAAAVPSAP